MTSKAREIFLAVVCILLFLVSAGAILYPHKPPTVIIKTATKEYSNEVIEEPTIPNQLQIRGERWGVFQINKKSPKDGRMAETDCDNHEINIYLPSFRTKDQIRQSLFHELLHAGACGKEPEGLDSIYWNSYSDAPAEHNGIDRLSSYLEDLFRSNPDLEKYLFG
jgi:hypothetical protein